MLNYQPPGAGAGSGVPGQPSSGSGASFGYAPSAVNRQPTQGLSIPGAQALQGGPGDLGAKFPNYGTSAFSVPSSWAIPSSFSQPQPPNPQDFPKTSAPNMNQYNHSSNISTLLRALIGNPGA